MKLRHVAKSQWYTYCCSLFFCVYILYKRRLLRLPLRPLPSPRTTTNVRDLTRWESAIFMSDWTWVEGKKKKKTIQVTMQCCVSSTRGSSQPSRSPPQPRWWDIISEHQDRVLAFFFFFLSSLWESEGRLSGLPLEAPQGNYTLIIFFWNERKMLAHGQCGGWFHYFDGSPEGVTAMLSRLNYPPC